MKIAVIPKGVQAPSGQDLVYDLFEQFTNNGHGAVGGSVPHIVNRLGLAPSERAWDFSAIAMAAVATDEGCSRLESSDGWTRQLNLTVSVSDSVFWTSQAEQVSKMLSFLTGDLWNVSFIDGGTYPAPPKQVQPRPEDAVCLLSGGMDSLIGAIDLIDAGKLPLFVSQVAKGDKHQQTDFARRISSASLHLQMNHNAKQPHQSERSQRARSLGFFGFAVLAATSLQTHRAGGRVMLYVPENGFISVNVPLTPLRLGSLSTRTTHPTFLGYLQTLLDAADLRVDVCNPYQFKTKGEMLKDCSNQPLLKYLAGTSTSCGRFARTGFRQCGRCVPCLVRRAAFEEWGVPDNTSAYKYPPNGQANDAYKRFADVRAAAMATHVVERHGVEHWVGGVLNTVPAQDRGPLIGVAGRGIAEIGKFLRHQGVM